MNVWKITEPRNLVKEDCPIPETEEGKIRVRVTKMMLSRVDGEIYKGNVKTKFPLIPGRFAVGKISSQTENAFYPKNMRVLLHTFCEAEDLGTEKRDFSEEDVKIRGMTVDGFLRDFVNVRKDDVTPLPDSVSDTDALLVHYIAIAKTVIDRLGVKKGSRVAVVGADFLGILISQLLIYQQASPILIDTQPERLNFAKRCGIYYTIRATDGVLDDVAAITGGRLADGAIYVKTAGGDPLLPLRLVAGKGKIVVCASDRTGFSMDLELAIRKQITISYVSDPEGSLESAINLIVSKAINLELLKNTMKTIDQPDDFFNSEDGDFSIDTFRIHIYNLM